jgi:PRTRC genetic system ThiF family protein
VTYHSAHRSLHSSTPVRVCLVGCGGNGARLLVRLADLARCLRLLGHPGLEVVVVDGDTVSEANLARQPFTPGDVGTHKAVALVTRINLTYGLAWEAVPRYFEPGTLDGVSPRPNVFACCVDTRRARRTIAEELGRYGNASYVLDLGNDAKTGQFALGTLGYGHEVPLPSAAELWPEIADPSLDGDDGPSCSSEEAVRRQDLFVHDVLASSSANLLWRLFREGRISHHGGFCNLETGVVAPLPVPEPKPAAETGPEEDIP